MNNPQETPVSVTFNPEMFNARLKEEVPFSDKLKQQIDLIKMFESTKCSFEDLMVLVSHTYDNMEEETFNQLLFKTFKTNPKLNVFKNMDMEVSLISWNIGESKTPFQEIKYKTVTSEKADAYKIIEDKTFACTRPEIVESLTNFKIYELRARFTEEVTKVPYYDILEKLKSLNKSLPYFFEYVVTKVLGLRQDIKLNQLMKLSEKTLFDILCWLNYRNDKDHKNDLAWNVDIKQKTKVDAIGYFTISDKNGVIANFFIDDRFRGLGLANQMLAYIDEKLLPNNDYLLITTKHPAMKKAIVNIGGKYVGKCLPYIETNNTSCPTDKNEFIYALLNKKKYPTQDIPFAILMDLDSWKNSPEFSSIIYDKFADKLIKKPDCGLLEMDTIQVYNDWITPQSENIIILGVTNDASVLPEYFDPFTNTKMIYPHLVVLDTITNDVWMYPLNGEEDDKYQISLHQKFIEKAVLFTMDIKHTAEYDQSGNKVGEYLEVIRNNNTHKVKFTIEVIDDATIQITSNNLTKAYGSIKEFINSSDFQPLKYGVDLHPYRFSDKATMFLPYRLDADGKVILKLENEEARMNKGIFELSI